MADSIPLAKLVQERHLGKETIHSYREAFESSSARFVVLERFLVPEVASRLSSFLRDEAQYEKEHGLYSAQDHDVDAATWHAASPGDRFFRFGKLVGTAPEFHFSDNSLTYLTFRTTFQKDEHLRRFFEAITGLELAASDDFGSHSMEAGDFLSSHDDNNRNRRLALVLYLTPDWKPEYGGALHIMDDAGGEWIVEPTYDSLVAFDTKAGTTHSVAPIREAAGQRSRLTIGGWYHDSVETDNVAEHS